MHAAAGSIVQRWLTPDYIEQHPAPTAKVLAMIAGIPPKGYTAMAAAVRDMDQRASLTEITMPVLVIAGARDAASPPATGEAIAEAIPNAKLAILDAAHLSNFEASGEFTKLMLAFLRQGESTPARTH